MSDLVVVVVVAIVFVLFFLKKAIHGKSICEEPSKLPPPVREEPSKLSPPVRKEPSKLPPPVREEPSKLPPSVGLNLNAKEFIFLSSSEQPITPLQPVCKESQQSDELCVEWLTEGVCEYGATCHHTNSHTPTNKGLFEFLPKNMCIFYVHGVCTRKNCRFVHDVSAINKKWNQPELSISTTSSVAPIAVCSTPPQTLLAHEPVESASCKHCKFGTCGKRQHFEMLNPNGCWYCYKGNCHKHKASPSLSVPSKAVCSTPPQTLLAHEPVESAPEPTSCKHCKLGTCGKRQHFEMLNPNGCWYCYKGNCHKHKASPSLSVPSKAVCSTPPQTLLAHEPVESAPKPTSAVPSSKPECWFCENHKCTKKAHLVASKN